MSLYRGNVRGVPPDEKYVSLRARVREASGTRTVYRLEMAGSSNKHDSVFDKKGNKCLVVHKTVVNRETLESYSNH